MARKKGGFVSWLRKLFGRSKNEESDYYNGATAQPARQPARDYQSQYSSQPPQYPAPTHDAHAAAYRERNAEIAQKQVAGIRRAAGQGYVSAYPSRTAGPDDWEAQQAAARRRAGGQTNYDQTTMSSYGTEAKLLGDGKVPQRRPAQESAWKGKPVGKQYDRREELTEEDEDMWARMAM
ncbi:hypothetical protein NKR23_g1228 [Pleurostoma richardsiae]|uniref:Uncharacterized protein n=1 Tax=Pleurostoma richardsiae TaxID=41990 RepID=A0AA38RTV5_9PEZI|nr:hypothetical protein NKR23_g1228 [Pleurostoma richardsiae]